MENIQTIFENIDEKLFSAEAREKMSNLIEQKIQEKVDERVSLELEAALASQYEKFIAAGKKLVEKIDEDHSQKIIHATKVMKEKFGSQLAQIKEAHEKVVLETAQKHKDDLVRSINSFIDISIEKSIPRTEIVEAARNGYASNLLEEMRKFLAVDPKFINENIKEAIVDGKRQLDALQKENKELKRKTALEEGKVALEKRLKHLPSDAAKFAKKLLENRSKEYIEENFKYVMELYKKHERNEIVSERHKPVASVPERVKSATQVVAESHIQTPHQSYNADNPLESFYMAGLEYKK